MKLATNNISETIPEICVLLDFGRYNRGFYYLDGKKLGVEVGDIVLVKLKGRFLSGLVLSKSRTYQLENISSHNECKSISKYSFIEEIIQKRIIQESWKEWLESLANLYKVTNLKMFKTAFPPGWIGKYKENPVKRNYQFWIDSLLNIDSLSNELTKKQKLLLNQINSKGGLWQTQLIRSGFSSTIINSLVKKNLVKRIKRLKSDEFNHKLPLRSLIQEEAHKLTEQQLEAVAQIQNMQPGESLLLWGETGSGKTEVYLRTVEDFIKKRKSCLVLAPEIGLIPQLIDRFTARLGHIVFEYHSNCSAQYRSSVWKKSLISDDPIVVIGTRSAIFLPLRNLGMIILDEEHDTSYKQENPMPCYDAREVAIDRTRKNQINLLLGSATPSMNTWKKFFFEKNIKMVRMKDRISSTKIPEIEIVDMRKEFQEGNTKILSNELIKSLNQIKSKKEQAIILIPRRGYNGFLSCRNCGHVVNCPNCEVSLTVHMGSKGNRWLSCHWCDYKSRYINNCPDCHSTAFKPFGIGTQRVIEVLNSQIPNLRLLRFDRDTTSGKDGHRKILDDFSNGNADVLVGTQMIAKGIDIPNVTLSVVIAADGLLHRPDLSAEEHSLQLFLQLAGRSGRADKTGKVIFQTYKPKHPVISYLKKRDYQGFLMDSSKVRKNAKLFPFCKVCLLKISGMNYELTEKGAYKLAEILSPICQKNQWNLIGPAPSLVSKVGKKYRWQILLHGPDQSQLPLINDQDLFDSLPKDVYLTIDINPIEI